MNDEWDTVKPKKILQIFSKIKQKEFHHFSAEARLAWLENIKSLYFKTSKFRNPKN
ncbi:MAG: hypothetical protein L6420_02810 [Elusimicrobia bacterium]|nr:hypothetical protein [Elusimicrobiota bacterium]